MVRVVVVLQVWLVRVGLLVDMVVASARGLLVVVICLWCGVGKAGRFGGLAGRAGFAIFDQHRHCDPPCRTVALQRKILSNEIISQICNSNKSLLGIREC